MTDDAAGLIRQGYLARREERLGDAHRDFGQAVKLCREAGEKSQLIQALKGVAQIERDGGRPEAALPLYEEAVSLCRQEAHPLMLAHTVRHLGDLHRHLGRLDLAEPCYQEALSIYRSQEETSMLDLANAVRPLAILKEDTGEREEAIRLWKEARDLYAGVNVQEGVDESSAHLARLGGNRPSA